MKNLVILFLVGTLLVPVHSKASLPATNEIFWFGIDYSLVQFIGARDQFNDLPKIKAHYFRAWNELIMVESSKYDLKKAFSVGEIVYSMENTIARSEAREMDGIVQSGSYSLDEDQVKNVVWQNTDASVDKIGAMFIMETLNKTDVHSTMWLAIFKVSSGEILYLEKYKGAVGGFGFRNYWARSYYNVISKLEVKPRS